MKLSAGRKKLKREAGLRLAVGLFLVGISVFLLFSGTHPDVGKAQGGLNYTTTWKATQLVTVTSKGEKNSPLLGPVPLGVTKWEVEARENGSNVLLYREQWSASVPQTGSIVYLGNTQQFKLPDGFSPAVFKSDWLYSAGVTDGNNPDGGTPHDVTYSFITINDGSSLTEYFRSYAGRRNFTSRGTAAHCVGSNADCLVASGVYGFTLYENFGDGIGNFPNGFGMLMPLKWTVSGSLSD